MGQVAHQGQIIVHCLVSFPEVADCSISIFQVGLLKRKSCNGEGKSRMYHLFGQNCRVQKVSP